MGWPPACRQPAPLAYRSAGVGGSQGERLRARLETLDGGKLGELENKMGERDARIRALEKELRVMTEAAKREDHRSLAKENERLEAEVRPPCHGTERERARARELG